MYQDNGKLNIDLLADVGYIANRVRQLDERLSLDRTKSDCLRYPYPVVSSKTTAEILEENKLLSTNADAPANAITDTDNSIDQQQFEHRNSATATQIADEICKKLTENIDVCGDGTAVAGCSGRRYSCKHIEDVILDFYEKHLIYHQNQEKERLNERRKSEIIDRSTIRSKIYHLTGGDTCTMNKSSTIESQINKIETSSTITTKETTSAAIALSDVELNAKEQINEDVNRQHTTRRANNNNDNSDETIDCKKDKNNRRILNRNNRIDDDKGETIATTTTANVSTNDIDAGADSSNVGGKHIDCSSCSLAFIGRSNVERNSIAIVQQMPEIQISNTDDDTATIDVERHDNDDATSGYADDVGIVSGVCSHYCGGWQSSICANQLSDEDLKKLVIELKRKVEFTERMNWLCLTKRPAGPPHRKTSLPKHSDVKKRFMEICDRTLSEEIKSALRLPAFDSYEWEDEDVLYLMQTMFIDTGLVDKFNIPIGTLREWLYEVYKHYNAVPFHNFRHCFCVAQMMYAISWRTNLAARVGELELLILLVSCICHDLDHPGYNNIYQINARTELALRYNDISPLENHHCSIAFRLLEHPDCNIFKNFNKEQFKEIREGIIRCILATDMARHNEILTQFKEVTPNFDYNNEGHLHLLCMILIKVADISNEARPMDIAEPWLERLLQEFFAQSAAEKSEGLPVTPFMDPDKVSKPGSQVRFIGLVLLPLFEALGELMPELVDFIIQPVRDALDYYKRLNDMQTRSRKSLGEVDGSSDGGASPQMPRSQSGISMRSRRSIPSQKSASRTSVDEPLCISAELHDLPEGSESGDSETATEVEFAEKTSKFKVDTESGNRKNNQTTTRKGSREKRPSMISELYTTGAGTRMRGSYGNIHAYHNNRSNFGANRAVSLDQYNSSNRRSSDGLQQVTSDNNVYYNHHHQHIHQHQPRQNRSLDNEVPATITENVRLTLSSDHDGNGTTNDDTSSADTINRNIPFDEKIKLQQQQIQQFQQQHKYTSNKLLSNASTAANNGTKSFMSRLRQFTGRFSFSFERDPKRNNTITSSAPNASRNNNSNETTSITKSSFCCANKIHGSPQHNPNKNSELIFVSAISQQANNTTSAATQATSATALSSTMMAARNRAHSLDVPCGTRYSSSNSGGGDSRKSSRNDDNNHLGSLMMEDNNSNHTTIGDNKSVSEGVDDSFAGSAGGGVGGGGI